MNQFKIILYTDDTIAKQILKGWMYKIYKIKIKSFLTIIEKKLKKHSNRVEKDKERKIFIEESEDLEYLEKSKKEVDDFLYLESSKLGTKGTEEYTNLVNDRTIQKLNSKAHKFTNKVKDKAFKMALGGDDVQGFFARQGIIITTELKKDGNI